MSVKSPWWLWPNLLGLDIPLLAVVWQQAFAMGAGVSLRWPARVGLFSGVWLIYLLDRVWDSVRCVPGPQTALRHQFAGRHRRGLLAWSGVLAVGLTATAAAAPVPVISAATGLAAVVGAYFCWNQWIRPNRSSGWAKEAVVAVVFAVGCALAPLVWRPSMDFIGPLAAFAALCLANTLFIAFFEHPSDIERGEISAAAEGVAPRLPWACLGVSVLAALLIPGWPRFSAAVVAAAALTAAAPWAAGRWGPEAGGRWADAALLAPVFWICFG